MIKTEIRSFFNKVFSGGGTQQETEKQQHLQSFKLLNTFQDVFTETVTPSMLNDLTVNACIDTIARHISKLKPVQSIPDTDSGYNYLLSHRPNPLMSTTDFLYKIASKSYLYGNCFIYIQRDHNTGRVKSLYPLDYATLELKEVDGDIFCKFTFADGNKKTVPYSDIIHIRRNFRGEILGDSPAVLLNSQIQLLDTCKRGLANVVKNSTALKGYLKYNILVKEKDKVKAVEEFNNIAKNGGISVVDGDAEYKDLSKQPLSADTEQLNFVRSDILKFFGVSESIISGNYTENEFQAFYESVLEPFTLQLSLEFTDKIFTEKQRAAGYEILFSQNRLQYSSTASKVDMIYKLLPHGVLTINDALEIMNLSKITDDIGDKRFMTLNNTTASQIDAGG